MKERSNTPKTSTATSSQLLKPAPNPFQNPLKFKEQLEAAAERGPKALAAAVASLPKEQKEMWDHYIPRLEAKAKLDYMEVAVTANLSQCAYADFAIAAQLHGCTLNEIVERFLNSDEVMEWRQKGCYLD